MKQDFETFLPDMDKNSHFGQKNYHFVQKLRISWKFSFSQRVWNGSIPEENYFELQNEPHWTVLTYFGVLYHFCRKWPKTTVMGKKVATQK